MAGWRGEDGRWNALFFWEVLPAAGARTKNPPSAGGGGPAVSKRGWRAS